MMQAEDANGSHTLKGFGCFGQAPAGNVAGKYCTCHNHSAVSRLRGALKTQKKKRKCVEWVPMRLLHVTDQFHGFECK